VPSLATIWAGAEPGGGFITPQPPQAPSQLLAGVFQAELPNECWQADTTHSTLADGADVEVLNVFDDHSRLLVASPGLCHHEGR